MVTSLEYVGRFKELAGGPGHQNIRLFSRQNQTVERAFGLETSRGREEIFI